ncbi:LysR substrate-binding domain-containing protein [Undibacterium arcticum]|uniref:LysR substrate-binding domain-containing protein n=1 Tax=Undibacterium arcticum TaxID=1762892 RepID=UPI003611C857
MSIAASSVQAALLLPRFIKQFYIEYPDVKVELYDVAEHEVPKMVCSGEVDFGIGTESGNRLDLAAHLLSADAFVVVMRADHALARKRELRWQGLVHVPLIGPRQGNPIRERLDSALATEGIVLSNIGLPGLFQAPVYVQPRPVYVQPEPVYVQPEPVYVEPEPVYVEARPVYIEQEREHDWREQHRHERHHHEDRHDERHGHDNGEHRGHDD